MLSAFNAASERSTLPHAVFCVSTAPTMISNGGVRRPPSGRAQFRGQRAVQRLDVAGCGPAPGLPAIGRAPMPWSTVQALDENVGDGEARLADQVVEHHAGEIGGGHERVLLVE